MNPAIEKQIGENIKKLRIKSELTQELLAAKLQLEGCDITRSAVAKIEVGQRHLYPDEIILIKKILNTTYDEILKDCLTAVRQSFFVKKRTTDGRNLDIRR